MPDPEQWIVIPKWEDFQHRDAARVVVPTWVKTFTKLLSDSDYLDLSGHRRAVLHGLWLEYARSTRRLRLDTLSLSRRLALRVTTADLEALNHAGFIHFSASKHAGKDAGTPAGIEERREEKRREQDQNPQRFALLHTERQTVDLSIDEQIAQSLADAKQRMEEAS